jgi:hypothetical protein
MPVEPWVLLRFVVLRAILVSGKSALRINAKCPPNTKVTALTIAASRVLLATEGVANVRFQFSAMTQSDGREHDPQYMSTYIYLYEYIYIYCENVVRIM